MNENTIKTLKEDKTVPETSKSFNRTAGQVRKINTGLLLILLIIFTLAGGTIGWYLRDQTIWLYSTSKIPQGSKELKQNNLPIVIGGISPLTGDAASFGIPIQQAAILAQKEINEQGGINHRLIEFLWEDGRCEKEDARAAAEKLVNKKHVELLIAGVCSSEFLAAAPIAQAKKIISFSPSATSPQISSLGKYIFRTSPSDALTGKAAAQYAFNKWKSQTAAVIAENKDYTLSLGKVFEKEFTALGGEVLLSDTFDTGTTDFTSYVAAVKEKSPQVVYILPQTPTPGILFVKTLKEAGVTARLLTAEVLLIRDAIVEQGSILEGVTGIEVLFDENRPKAKHFLDLYKQEYNLDPTYPGFMAGMYDIVYLIKQAYEAVGSDPDKVVNYLYNLKNWDGAIGVLNFDSHGDPTLSYSIRLISSKEAPQVDIYTPAIK